MNFFKAVFTDDPDPPSSPTSDHESSPSSLNPTIHTHQPTTSDDDDASEPTKNQTTPWSFGGLIKTLQVKSDWIETYRRDLEEFGSGLKKETEVLREVASRAVKDLPSSLEIGASKAQVSLESVGQAIDSIGLAVADIISQGKESLLANDNDSSYAYDVNSVGGNSNAQSIGSSGRYSRFDAQLRAIQCDVSTYVDEPDDVNDYNKWLSAFKLEEKSEEIEGLMRENGSVDGIYKRVVPNNVEHDVFWSRYFYRVHRLNQAESMRARLVKRAISTEDEEELSWDVDDEDEEEVEVKKVDESDANVNNSSQQEENEQKNVEEHKVVKDSDDESSVPAEQRAATGDKMPAMEKSGSAVESADKELSNKETQSRETPKAKDGDEALKKPKEKVTPEGKTEVRESGKDSDISVVSTQPSTEEDDMGWDEIADIGSDDEKKVTRSKSPDREELRKRLSAADDDEDLSWDIEEDD